MTEIKTNLLFLLILLINLMTLTICDIDNEDITKAISCMSILSQKYEEKTDSKTYFSLMLKCFITITDVEAKEILVGIEQGIKSMEDEDIQKLIDIESLKNISQTEIQKQSLRLKKAIKSFQNMQKIIPQIKKIKIMKMMMNTKKLFLQKVIFLGL